MSLPTKGDIGILQTSDSEYNGALLCICIALSTVCLRCTGASGGVVTAVASRLFPTAALKAFMHVKNKLQVVQWCLLSAGWLFDISFGQRTNEGR